MGKTDAAILPVSRRGISALVRAAVSLIPGEAPGPNGLTTVQVHSSIFGRDHTSSFPFGDQNPLLGQEAPTPLLLTRSAYLPLRDQTVIRVLGRIGLPSRAHLLRGLSRRAARAPPGITQNR